MAPTAAHRSARFHNISSASPLKKNAPSRVRCAWCAAPSPVVQVVSCASSARCASWNLKLPQHAGLVRGDLAQGARATSQPCVMPAAFRLTNLPVSVLPAHQQEKILARAVMRQAAAHGTANDDDGDEHVVGFSEIRLASGKLHTVPVCGGLTLNGFYSRVKAVLGLSWPLDVRLLCLDTETAGAPALLPRDHDVLAREHVSGRAFQAVIYDPSGDDPVYELLMQARARLGATDGDVLVLRSPEYARAR